MIIVRNKGNKENLIISGTPAELDRMLAEFKAAADRMDNIQALFMDCHHSRTDKTLSIKPRHNV